MSRLESPRAILFDWDNTLVDTWPVIHQALNMTMRHMQHDEWTLEEVKRRVARSMRDSFPELFGTRWEEAAKHYQQSYRSIHLQQLQPLPGAEAMLQSIPDDIFVGVVSNKRGPTLRDEMKHLGWERYFDVAIGSDDAARDKPHPDPVILALKDFSQEFGKEVWFVGDSVVDLECAANVGATPVFYGVCASEDNIFEGFPFAAKVCDQQELQRLIAEHPLSA